ncbi:MAG: ComEC/Rec2 family competence protein [Propionibacteriaceae bacterium]
MAVTTTRPDSSAGAGATRADRVHDLRLVPLALAAWAGSWLGTSGAGWGTICGVVGVAGALIITGWRRSLLGLAVAILLASSLGLGAVRHHQLHSGPLPRLADAEAVVQVELTTAGEPRVRPDRFGVGESLVVRGRVLTVTGRGEQWSVRTPVLVMVSGASVDWWVDQPVGTRFAVLARASPAEPADDVAAIIRVRQQGEVASPPGPGLRAVERVRDGLRTAVEHRRPDQRALVPALVLGDVSRVTDELRADFQTTGLTHLTAVSGANLTLLLAFVLVMARGVGVRGWWLRLLALAGVVVFVALCRSEPSVLRAAAMGLVGLAALGADPGRGFRRGLRSLSLAMVLLLIIDPWLGRSVGFALSVLASAGIIWWSGGWADRMARWLPRWVAEALAVPMAAQLATQPVVTAISGQVSVVGLVANAVAGPLVGPATVLGFAAAGLSLLSSWLAAVAGFGAAWCAQGIIWIAQWGALLPGAAWAWPSSPVAIGVVALGSLGLGLLVPTLLSRRWVACAVVLIMVVALLRAPVVPGWPPRGWVLAACDVGQGDGLVVPVGRGAAVVVDTGPEPEPMDRCLRQLGIRSVPLVILTHFHADHVGGLAGVVSGRQAGEVWVSPVASPVPEAERVTALAAEAGAAVRVPAVGASGSVGAVEWEVLGPVAASGGGTEAGEGESSAENDSSLVLRLTVDGTRILLTGDVEPAGQRAILASGADLSADVLKAPHHGSARQERDFFAATGASVVVASAGEDNSYGHPAPSMITMARSLGMTVLRTDQQGGVALTRSSRGLGAVTQR